MGGHWQPINGLFQSGLYLSSGEQRLAQKRGPEWFTQAICALSADKSWGDNKNAGVRENACNFNNYHSNYALK